jgi:hypothetical protein
MSTLLKRILGTEGTPFIERSKISELGAALKEIKDAPASIEKETSAHTFNHCSRRYHAYSFGKGESECQQRDWPTDYGRCVSGDI